MGTRESNGLSPSTLYHRNTEQYITFEFHLHQTIQQINKQNLILQILEEKEFKTTTEALRQEEALQMRAYLKEQETACIKEMIKIDLAYLNEVKGLEEIKQDIQHVHTHYKEM